MSNPAKGLNDIAWELLFDKYDILNRIHENGRFEISATQIKEFREPRLMAKFDHTINLPRIFTRNKLAILPITRGDYVIAPFCAYHTFETEASAVTRVSLPSYIQSLDCNNITSEAVALNCAVCGGIVADFLEEEVIFPTVSGRMGSGTFGFQIERAASGAPCHIQVQNAQIEIDAAYEGHQSLALFEAKRDLSEDFLVRQLYYPYRVWQNRMTKPVRPVFLVYSNGIYRLYEYRFTEPDDYSSLILVKQKNYSIEDTRITLSDIQRVLHRCVIVEEPEIPFPQADSFERVINLCELLSGQEMSRNDVTEQYAFDARQTNYYTDAARYLGLLEKRKKKGSPVYTLSNTGKKLLGMHYKQRQLALCNCILSHKAFNTSLQMYFKSGVMPAANEIVQVMKQAGLYQVERDSTYRRRASTVKGWLHWVLSLATQSV